MKILNSRGEQTITCPHCNSVLLVDDRDLIPERFHRNYVLKCCWCQECFQGELAVVKEQTIQQREMVLERILNVKASVNQKETI